MYFTALQKWILLNADSEGKIFWPISAAEAEVHLGHLLNLENRGFVKRMQGNIPMLPFLLSAQGKLIKSSLMNCSGRRGYEMDNKTNPTS